MPRRDARIEGRGGRIRCDWPTAALLRDNVMHWVEGGEPTGRYPNIHALAERATLEEAPPIDAHALARELDDVVPALRGVSGADVAVGLRTHARLTHQPRPSARGTILARLVGWTPPVAVGGDMDLGRCFEPLRALVRRAAGLG